MISPVSSRTAGFAYIPYLQPALQSPKSKVAACTMTQHLVDAARASRVRPFRACPDLALAPRILGRQTVLAHFTLRECPLNVIPLRPWSA
jgi:hypothetical protein